MYAKGSHEGSLHDKFWPPGWLQGKTPAEYEFGESHPDVETVEAVPTDILMHSQQVHHGSHPNGSPKVRWHLELGIQDANHVNKVQYYRPGIPVDATLPSLLRYIREMGEFSSSYQEAYRDL
ncbi:unnamed protein product [Polarella glacialis]|uniref:Uncharacterized protein n=1 Tax=Polarella glacialis TaxID=89957 RepID=A0A813HCH3_POLGL|nr:unnamed protein product [Polarella glacialis]|mmetsp:Transcript_76701/g.138392  ORF Transcript_76701/g.138392 Transcript_76701/m.138392 type:complete len:122 (-) Transcript_76701:17-382(-)